MPVQSFLSTLAVRCRNSRTQRLAAFLVPALVGAVLGCDEHPQSPFDTVEPIQFMATAPVALSFHQVSAGDLHSCGLTSDNRAYCWGHNWAGQLGDGTRTDHLTPMPVVTEQRFRQISAGWATTCAITTDSRAYCWGKNGGQIGDGTSQERWTPTPVATTTRFRQIATGQDHTCAVGYDDLLPYCWGDNHYGQLGEGSQNPHLTPLAAAGKLRMREVHTAAYHSCGVTTGNVPYCWGWNESGQIGQSTPGTYHTTPTRVRGGLLFRTMTTGWYHSCGVTTGSRVYCWGRGLEGQIGDGTTTTRFAPRAVASTMLFDRVTGGGFFTCAESQANKAYCWGANNIGQFGDGSTTSRYKPTLAAGGLSVAQLSAGHGHACAKTPASEGYCWGWNYYGQVGDGTTTTRHSPVRIASAP